MENKGNHFLYKVYDTTVVHKLDSQRQKAFSEGVKVGKKNPSFDLDGDCNQLVRAVI